MNDNNNTPLIAVFDIGKTNVKLNVVTAQGEVLETLSTPNTFPGRPALPPPRPHRPGRMALNQSRHALPPSSPHHLRRLRPWLRQRAGGRRRPSSPMIDYEQPIPPSIKRAYAQAVGPYLERGSPVMLGATHIARQMLWLELEHPQDFARARHILGLPQYWAWRLSGVAASEVTILGAQSHIWNTPGRRPAAIVTARGWQRLIPPFAPAWKALGPIRPRPRPPSQPAADPSNPLRSP